MENYQYISIPISYLEKNNLSKLDFLMETSDSEKFLKSLLDALPPYLEIKNLFLIKSNFVAVLGNSNKIKFDNSMYFNQFYDFIGATRFADSVSFDYEKKEISISKDIPHIFYNLLSEFLV